MIPLIHKALTLCRREPVLCIALLLALASFFLTPPSWAVLDSIDGATLCLLFALMAVVAGLRSCGLFDVLAAAIRRRVTSPRLLGLLMMSLCFFLSMVLTNDVALLTFVPFTLLLLGGAGESVLLWTVVLETMAANLGSMLTPIGNPQNLYLYMSRGLSLGDFLRTLLPYALVSYALLALGTLLLPRGRTAAAPETPVQLAPRPLLRCTLLLGVCLLSVFKVLPPWAAAAVVAAVFALRDPSLLRRVDWALLGTFLCFFLFVGNLRAVPAVSRTLQTLLAGRETLVAALCSQVISNVPATLLLAPFTDDTAALLVGVNLGGLGTLVASLASLISFKLYSARPQARRGRYVQRFTLANFALLALLLGLAALLQR